ncbi:rod shape-determining protein MreC [Spirochaeta lutea]|nr:rod shape-determining protein MreC [Spirochaeta lutea]
MLRLSSAIKKHKDSFYLLIVMVITTISLIISSDSGSMALRNLGEDFTGGLQTGAASVGRFFKNTLTSVSELASLQKEYDTVVERLQDLEQSLNDFEDVKFENQQLREMLEFKEKSSFETVPAFIVAKNPTSTIEVFTINKGRADGIAEGLPVVALAGDQQALVGRVVDVNTFTSRVLPITSNNHFIAARLQKSRYEGLVSGSGIDRKSLNMDYVDRDARNILSVGDMIITSGLDSIFPRGIQIGTIEEIHAQSWETSIHLSVRPSVSFATLEAVFVLKHAESNQFRE